MINILNQRYSIIKLRTSGIYSKYSNIPPQTQGDVVDINLSLETKEPRELGEDKQLLLGIGTTPWVATMADSGDTRTTKRLLHGARMDESLGCSNGLLEEPYL